MLLMLYSFAFENFWNLTSLMEYKGHHTAKTTNTQLHKNKSPIQVTDSLFLSESKSQSSILGRHAFPTTCFALQKLFTFWWCEMLCSGHKCRPRASMQVHKLTKGICYLASAHRKIYIKLFFVISMLILTRCGCIWSPSAQPFRLP